MRFEPRSIDYLQNRRRDRREDWTLREYPHKFPASTWNWQAILVWCVVLPAAWASIWLLIGWLW